MEQRPVKIALTINEACNCLGVGRTLLYSEIKSGRLQKLKIGRRTLIPIADLKTWLASLKANAAARK